MISDRIAAFPADRDQDADALREQSKAAGVKAIIPARISRCKPALHDCTKTKWCNRIKRLFNKRKNGQPVATRYDKTRESCLGFVARASAKLWNPFAHKV